MNSTQSSFRESTPNGLTILYGIHFFNGETDYLQIDDYPELNFGTGDFTISAWVKTEIKTGIQVIFDKRVEVSGPVQGYVLAVYNGSLLLQLADGQGKGWVNYISPIFIADNQWHHIAVTIDRDRSNGIGWYLDGTQQSEFSNPTGKSGSLDNSKPLVIGRRSDHPRWPGYFHGGLANIQLFREVLSPQQIEALSADSPQLNY